LSRDYERSLWRHALNPDILESNVMEIFPYVAVFPYIHSTSKVDGQTEDTTAVTTK